MEVVGIRNRLDHNPWTTGEKYSIDIGVTNIIAIKSIAKQMVKKFGVNQCIYRL
jgi:hypothetical protein